MTSKIDKDIQHIRSEIFHVRSKQKLQQDLFDMQVEHYQTKLQRLNQKAYSILMNFNNHNSATYAKFKSTDKHHSATPNDVYCRAILQEHPQTLLQHNGDHSKENHNYYYQKVETPEDPSFLVFSFSSKPKQHEKKVLLPPHNIVIVLETQLCRVLHHMGILKVHSKVLQEQAYERVKWTILQKKKQSNLVWKLQQHTQEITKF